MKRFLFLILALLCVRSVNAGTITIQPDAAGLDATLTTSSPASNFGAVNILVIGELNTGADVSHGLLKFDLSSIPSAAKLESAQITLTVVTDYSTNARTMRVYPLLRNWVELEATWNVYSTGNAWQTAGGTGALDIGASIGSVALGASEAPGTAIVIPLTVDHKTDLGNYGFLFKTDTESDDGYAFASSDHATPAYRPKLEITYRLLDDN